LGAALVPGNGFADLEAIRASGRLRVLVVQRADEFYRVGPEGDSGFDREILEGFARRAGLRLETVPVDGWDKVFDALFKGQGDIIAGHLTATEARRKRMAFTDEVFPSRHVVVTYRPHRIIQNPEELRREKVGTVRGTSMEELIRESGVPPSNVYEVPVGSLPDQLRAGRVTATVFGVEGAIVWRRSDPNIQIGAFIGPSQSLAYALRQEDVALRAALNEHIRAIRSSRRWSMLVAKYFGSEATEILRRAREK
jgi:ABC-type amino acid transport substrate-binding protein